MKNHGKNERIEKFDRNRLFNSIMKVCLTARRPDGQAETTANAVCDKVDEWLKQRPEVTTSDIRRITAKNLELFDPEAAYLYIQTHITI